MKRQWKSEELIDHWMQLDFHSNNEVYCPIIRAIPLVKAYVRTGALHPLPREEVGGHP